MKRREMFAALAAGATLRPRDLAAMQGVILSELNKPVDLDGLRAKYHAGDPVNLNKLRAARWSRERAFKYMERFGVVKGTNYSPRSGGIFQPFTEEVRTRVFGGGARPRIEFPSADFNEQIITQELGWAQTVVGLNSLRVGVPIAEWQRDRERFYKVFDRFLEIAESKGMSVMPITGATGVRDPEDLASPAGPGPGRGGAQGGELSPRWDQTWPKLKPIMKEFIQSVLQRYAKDKRIIVWNLHNEPAAALRPLVEYEFQWAREVETSQPLTVEWNSHDLSDVITFHTYMRPGLSAPESAPARVDFLTELEWARAWRRPMLCTEWLARPFKNTVDNVLPFFSRYKIGWYNWCLVQAGQWVHPWNWPLGSPPPKEWFHGLLYPDGAPYSTDEILAIRDFKFQDPPLFVKTQSYWAYGDEVRNVPPPVS
jgi:hypothetical protein